MSSDEKRKVDELVTRAQTLLDNGDATQAAKLARESLSIAPNHVEARKLLDSLQSSSGASTFIRHFHEYIAHGTVSDGEEALRALKQPSPLGPKDAEAIFDDLANLKRPGLDLLDDIVGLPIANDKSVRKFLATKFEEQPTTTFRLLWNQGDRTVSALAGVCLDKSVYSDSQHQKNAARNVFQLALGKLIDAGQEHPERAMSAIARLLATDSDNLVDLLDFDAFDIILTFLDIHLPASIRSQATLATIKLLEATEDQGQDQLKAFVTGKFAKGRHDDMIVAFSAAAATFPIVPVPASQLFLTDGFLQSLVPVLEKNSRAAEGRRSHKLEHAALELLSNACIDKACREAIVKQCASWLREVADTSSDAESAGLSALVLAKIR